MLQIKLFEKAYTLKGTREDIVNEWIRDNNIDVVDVKMAVSSSTVDGTALEMSIDNKITITVIYKIE